MSVELIVYSGIKFTYLADVGTCLVAEEQMYYWCFKILICLYKLKIIF